MRLVGVLVEIAEDLAAEVLARRRAGREARRVRAVAALERQLADLAKSGTRIAAKLDVSR